MCRSFVAFWIVLAALAGAILWLQVSINRETVSALEVLNPEGRAGRALIVYHPGLSDLQSRLTSAFARGLVEAGWRVERTTTSERAPTKLSGYALLVLGVHTYWWSPDGPTRRYLERVGDLEGKPTVALLSALGAAGRAQGLTEELIRNHGGKLLAVQPLFTMRPNDEQDSRPNDVVAADLAYRLARRIASEGL
jgi:hypothetical protein